MCGSSQRLFNSEYEVKRKAIGDISMALCCLEKYTIDEIYKLIENEYFTREKINVRLKMYKMTKGE